MMRAFLLSLFVCLMGINGALANDQIAKTEHYRIEWTAGLDGYAEQITSQLEKNHQRIYGELGSEAAGPTTIWLHRNEESMRAAAEARHKYPPPEWAGGLAYPAKHEIYVHVGTGADELMTTLNHEISHIALGDLVGQRAPRWFGEGLAIRQSEGFSFERAWLMTQAAALGQLHDLDMLDQGFPEGHARAGVAYAQAVHFVGYLQQEFGPDKFRILLHELGDGQHFEAAAQTAFGVALSEIERRWRESLEVWWGWVPVIFGSGTLWGVSGLLLVLAWRRRRRRQTERLKTLRVAEMMDMAEDIEIAHQLDAPPRLHDPYDGRPPTIH